MGKEEKEEADCTTRRVEKALEEAVAKWRAKNKKEKGSTGKGSTARGWLNKRACKE